MYHLLKFRGNYRIRTRYVKSLARKSEWMNVGKFTARVPAEVAVLASLFPILYVRVLCTQRPKILNRDVKSHILLLSLPCAMVSTTPTPPPYYLLQSTIALTLEKENSF